MDQLIHVAVIHLKGKGKLYLFLKRVAEHHYAWFLEEHEGAESDTGIWAPTIAGALGVARKEWQDSSFRMLNCGFRYNLPERDEHGENALYYEMAASYAAPLGIYFDELAGHNCIVHNASSEARELFERKKGKDGKNKRT